MTSIMPNDDQAALIRAGVTDVELLLAAGAGVPAEPPMPTSVRVGPHIYTIRDMSEANYIRTGFLGSHLYSKLEIEIYPDQPYRIKGEVLLHEILHAAYSIGGLRIDGPPTEERTVDAIGLQLFGVLRDNPEVLDYIVGAARSRP